MKTNNKIRLAALLLFGVLAYVANGQNIIRPKIECPNDIYVNAYNGVLFHQRPDLSIPTRGGNMEVAFYYNSIYNSENHGYGNGWTLGAEMRYIPDSTGITIENGNGRHDRFARYGNQFVAPAGVFATLTKNGTSYQFEERDGTRYIFGDSATKCVTQIVDRNNNSISMTYVNGHLTEMNDDAGRSIYFQWNNGQMTQVSTSFNNWTWGYQYDGQGNLVQVTDPSGNNKHYGYGRDNRMLTMSDNEGNTTYVTYANDHYVTRVKTNLTDRAIHYDLKNHITTVVDYMTDDINQFTIFHWDDQGRITAIEGNNATKMSRYEYDNSNNIIRQTDGNGNVTSFTYDNHGNLLSATDAQNQTVRYTYANYGRLASYTDQMGHEHHFSYDAHGNLTTYSNPMNQTSTYSYNSYGQVIATTDALNHTTTYSYDTYGNLASKTDPLNHTTTYNYTSAGQLSTLIMPNQSQYSFSFDHQNRLTRFVNASDYTTRLQYDSRGNLSRIFYPLSHILTLQYNGLNQVERIISPRGDTTTIGYNNRILPNLVVDGLGNATRLLYDQRSRLSAIVDAMGDTTQVDHDGMDNITRVQLPNGRVVEYRYNNLNQLVLVTDQVDTLAAYTYDGVGRMSSMTNEAGNTTTFAYNPNGQLILTTDGLGNSENYTYDAAGNMTGHTDALNHTTTYSYNAANQLIGVTDALGHTTTYSYDANGNVASVTDANGHTTQFSYNSDDRLTDIRFANNATRHYTYNGLGLMASYTNEAGETTLYGYDANGYLSAKNCLGQMTMTYTRDALGRIISASKGTSTVNFAYDGLGRMVSENNSGATTHYLYNTNNRTRTVTYPGGRTIVEQYDVRGKLTSQSENNQTIANYSYLGDGSPVTFSFSNNTATTFTYNDADLLSSIITTPQILNLQNEYDNAGNLLSRLDGVNANRSENYAYDNLNRLTEYKQGAATTGGNIQNPLSHIQYVLDAVGNRNSVSIDGTSISYAKNDLNQYTSVGNVAFEYDSKGNLTNDGVHYYEYDMENHLIAVDGGTTASYAYDALGRRISKTDGLGTTYYFYDGNNVIEERNAQSNTLASYIYANGIDQVVQMKRGNDIYYYHVDELGSVMAVTNASGALVERYSYDPYGTPTIYGATGNILSQSTIDNRFLFTGREYDTETGLYHYRARTMHPELGRFNQTDPLLFADDLNLYSYVGNMPTSFIDPLGLKRADWATIIGDVGDIAGGVLGGLQAAEKLGDLSKAGKVLSNFEKGSSQISDIGGMLNSSMSAGDGLGSGDYLAGAKDLAFTIADYGIWAGKLMGFIVEGTLAADAVAVYGAFKTGVAIGTLIDHLVGDKITNALWKVFGDKDEDIKATGVHPRFPEPCGGNNSTQKK